MSSAGYGNHAPSRPGDASNQPAAGGPKDEAGAGRQTGTGPAPDGAAPRSGEDDRAPQAAPDGDRRHVATPGDGAGPSGPQGTEVDPGAG